MDFIERIFGVSPDGGSGMIELLLFILPLLGLVAVILRVNLRTKMQDDQAESMIKKPKN